MYYYLFFFFSLLYIHLFFICLHIVNTRRENVHFQRWKRKYSKDQIFQQRTILTRSKRSFCAEISYEINRKNLLCIVLNLNFIFATVNISKLFVIYFNQQSIIYSFFFYSIIKNEVYLIEIEMIKILFQLNVLKKKLYTSFKYCFSFFFFVR